MINEQLSPDNIKQNLLSAMPDNLKNAFERVTIAGMKLFYSKDIQAQIMDDDDEVDAPMFEQLAKGTIAITSQLWTASNSTIPPQVIIPAAIYLLVEGADFLDKSGKFEVTDDDIGQAIEASVVGILDKFGIDSAKAQELAAQLSDQAETGEAISVPSQVGSGAPQSASPNNGLLNQGAA
jgi:hypothetical protein